MSAPEAYGGARAWLRRRWPLPTILLLVGVFLWPFISEGKVFVRYVLTSPDGAIEAPGYRRDGVRLRG